MGKSKAEQKSACRGAEYSILLHIEIIAVLEFLLFTEVLLCLAVGFCAYHVGTKCFFRVSIFQ